ncbi:hypothetical protein L210DRAFT_3004192 [Boletus edulis BED1]|uniref:Uncharacterized protein n=1 Tax=Boletus edulis BED1 TaxID=1328754 RepID=A0AAD4BHX6_BOLED|nr:hypothetical protein L210DRAFT_3004192 [Boletus edulis BED1]
MLIPPLLNQLNHVCLEAVLPEQWQQEPQTITAMPAYNGTSLEQLRVQDYQDRRTSDTSGQTSSGTSAMPTTSPFPTPTMTKQHTVGLKFEGGTTGTPKASGKQPPTTGTITGPRAFTGNSVFGKPQQSSASASGEPKPGSTLAQPDSRQPECLEELARKFLLGEELVNTQFHLFSAKSFSSGPVMKPRALCANNALPAKSSKYFMDCEWFFHKTTIASFIGSIQC